MKTRQRRFFPISILSVGYGLVILTVTWLSPVIASQYRCETTPEILVSAADDSMVGYVCDAADRAIGFLARYQLQLQKPIEISIIEQSINQEGYMAFGSYDRQSDRIQIMSLPAILHSSQSPQMYNMPFDEEHYVGALAHEITHAIFQHNANHTEDQWTNAAQEYLAHATQLGVLSAARRAQIIQAAATGPWESGDEISVTYMGFNPTGFAVKSYLHLTQLSDPQTFIQILLHHKWLYISVP
ncbi:hypothetical protein SAMN03080615_02454 [Amphritea atlantica]|uniref:Peptidase MA superfamily protein n=1 Tax=Amphritea atlantica TaxID=355243 RepID=A0A1H9I665_9GAMM|nr:DUF6639 family protein [Amphritea atlantica]SEQ70018.1 hypothetical protein SAMN03080615_02454 [Amphritea atlantica]